MMSSALQVVHVVAGLIVMAEALNKIERSAPCAKGLTARQRVVEALKAAAWALLAMGAGGAIMSPLLDTLWFASPAVQIITHTQPSLDEVCTMMGFAVLIVRTRIKEG